MYPNALDAYVFCVGRVPVLWTAGLHTTITESVCAMRIVIITSQLPHRFSSTHEELFMTLIIMQSVRNAYMQFLQYIRTGHNYSTGEKGDKNSMEFWNEITSYTIFSFSFSLIAYIQRMVAFCAMDFGCTTMRKCARCEVVVAGWIECTRVCLACPLPQS